MSQEEYDTTFDTRAGDSPKLEMAFKQVADIRKFEIELYWKRAGYFWALIAVAFAGYFAILASAAMPNKFLLSFVVSLIGFTFTFAWYLANRGSKYWQENWENHLDLLEDSVTGPLYKTVLERPQLDTLSEKLVTGPAPFSVSKLNQWVSVFVLLIWFGLGAFSLYSTFPVNDLAGTCFMILAPLSLIVTTAVVCAFMYFQARTYQGDHTPVMRSRKTRIEGP